MGLSGTVDEPVPARLEQTLEFQFGEHFEVFSATQRDHTRSITLVGSYTEGDWTVTLKSGIISFGVFFQPTGLSRLFRIPPAEFSNRAFNALDVGSYGLSELYHQLAACPSFPARVAVMETFLLALAARVPARQVDLAYDAAARIFEANGAVRLRDFAEEYGLSIRQLERRLIRAIGIPPKTYARVARFQTALDRKLMTPYLSWMSIAHDLGYHDQMHMVHDFHELAGAAPSEILATIGDARPPAMQNFSEF
jgi:AraC-like DNA-binding protein